MKKLSVSSSSFRWWQLSIGFGIPQVRNLRNVKRRMAWNSSSMNHSVLSVILLFGSLTLVYHNGHRLDTRIKTCFRTSSGNKFSNLAFPLKQSITFAMHLKFRNSNTFPHRQRMKSAKNQSLQRALFFQPQRLQIWFFCSHWCSTIPIHFQLFQGMHSILVTITLLSLWPLTANGHYFEWLVSKDLHKCCQQSWMQIDRRRYLHQWINGTFSDSMSGKRRSSLWG